MIFVNGSLGFDGGGAGGGRGTDAGIRAGVGDHDGIKASGRAGGVRHFADVGIALAGTLFDGRGGAGDIAGVVFAGATCEEKSGGTKSKK